MTLLALAIAPGLAIMLYIYARDKYDREPIGLLLLCFIAGVLSAWPAVLLSGTGVTMLDQLLPIGSTPYNMLKAFAAVAFSEEFSKFFMVMLVAWRSKHFNEPFDGIVYAVMVSMGFATFENILYSFNYGMNTALVRMFTAVPAHATFAIMMGYYIGKAKFMKVGTPFFLTMGLFWAVMFHGSYDYFLFEIENYPMAFVGAIASLIIGIRLSKKALNLHSDASPFRV